MSVLNYLIFPIEIFGIITFSHLPMILVFAVLQYFLLKSKRKYLHYILPLSSFIYLTIRYMPVMYLAVHTGFLPVFLIVYILPIILIIETSIIKKFQRNSDINKMNIHDL